MGSALERFLGRPTTEVHEAYNGSILAPVAPEYTTGEGLVAAAYRKVLLSLSESSVDLEKIPTLPERLAERVLVIDPELAMPAAQQAFVDAWRDLVMTRTGLASPPPAQSKLPQLVPLVPEIGRYAGVIGRFGRNRWQPGNLLLSAMFAGAGLTNGQQLLERLIASLRVDGGDDILAQYVESCLLAVVPTREQPKLEDLMTDGYRAAAWREQPSPGSLPSERFVKDLDFVVSLKGILTRRQWVALLEAQLRLGLGMHQLWICRLNSRVWGLVRKALNGEVFGDSAVRAACWAPQETDEPFLELAKESEHAIRRVLSDYAQARLGLNLVLFLLDDVLGAPKPKYFATQGGATPASGISTLLGVLVTERDRLNNRCRELSDGLDAPQASGALADKNPKLLSAQAGVTRNLIFFIRYTLGQLQPIDEDLSPYDQSYLILKRERARVVRPAPAMLILLVHSCCQAADGVPASVDSLRQHIASYGISASADELRTGVTAHELERLGLVVDSPDAGGGRLLVDPLHPGKL